MARINIYTMCESVSLESYTVDELLEYVKGKPVIDVDLEELKWQYPHDRISKKRTDRVVIDGWPIVVYRDSDGVLKTLDGFHRAYRALKEKRKTIKAYLITDKDIAKLNSKSN